MNIAYTIFYSKDLDSPKLNRAANVNKIKDIFSKNFDYIDNNVITIKNFKDHKLALKRNANLASYKLSGSFRYGAIGLMFSTIIAYEKMVSLDYDAFLFLEDDAELDVEGLENLLHYFKNIPKNFDIISLHDNPFFAYMYDSKIHDIDSENFCLVYNRLSTMAYLISKNGMKKYLTYMQNVIDNPIDFFLFDKLKTTNQYAIKPSLPQPFLSNNFNEIGEPEYEFSNINKTDEVVL